MDGLGDQGVRLPRDLDQIFIALGQYPSRIVVHSSDESPSSEKFTFGPASVWG